MSVSESYVERWVVGAYRIGSIILAHGKYPAQETGSVVGVKQRPKSHWGGAKE
jgi:hypothetical protein